MKKTSELIGGVALAAAGIALIVVDILMRTSADSSALGSSGSITSSGILGIVCLLIGGLCIIAYVQGTTFSGLFRRNGESRNSATKTAPMQERHIEVPPEGSVDAKIIGITRNLRAENGREGFHVLCEYTDPKSGVRETFTSEVVPEYPGKQIIGKWVRVFFRNRDPENYFVDLRSIHG